MSTETSADVLAPPKPIMGDIIALAKDSWSAWTGGKPKADWTGLDPSSQTETTSPNQLRPVYVSAAQKGYNHRRTGMTTLFKPADDLTSFQNAVWDHLTDTGMDSIAYIPDPLDNQKMTNVVKSHARYTVQSAKLLVESQLSKYDKYDRTNDKAARSYLLASLAASLSNKVSEKLEDSDPFPIVWLQFLKAIQSTSIERFEDLKNSIKLRLPSQYPGENLEQLAAQFRKDARELTTAGQYDHNLTLSMMKIFLLAGGSGNEDYRFPLRATKQRLEQALLDIGFKEKTAANKHMNEQKLTYKDICAEAEDTYRTLFDRKEWPPARNVRDSKAPPTAFGNVASDSNSGITRAEVLNLIQNKPRFNAADSVKKTGNCNKCGKPGHWARECPDGKTASANPRAQRNTSRPDNRFNDRNSRKPGWRSVPPAPGAPTTKKNESHTFNWCAPCKRWTTTHSTATHRGKSSGGGEQQTSAMVSLVHDPSVWTTDVNVLPSMSDLLFVIWNHLPIVALLLLSLFPFILPGLMSFKVAAVQIGSYLVQVNYRLIVEFVLDFVFDCLGKFSATLLTNYNALPAPSLWFVLMMFLLWYRPDPSPTASAVDLPPLSRTHRRLLDKHSRRQFRMNQHEMQRRSILTEGLNRRYPICLRSLGRHLRRRNVPTIAQRDINWEIEKLKIEVLGLKNQVQRFTSKTPERPSQVPGREGGSVGANQKQGFAHCKDTFWSNQGQSWDALRKDTKAPNGNSGSNDRWLPANRSRASRTHDKKSAFYRPVTASGRKQEFSNTNWTDRQVHAAKKIALHVQMAQLRFNADGTTTRVALHAPSRFRSSMSNNAVFPVIWDSGASVTISPDKSDFVGSIVSPSTITQLKGIAKGLRIEGQGNVRWCVHDTLGNLRTLTLPAYYVPKIRIRLLSTTSLLQSYNNETIKVEADKLTLSGIDGDPSRNPVVARVNPDNNLPTSEAYRYEDTLLAAEALNATITAVNDMNFNLTEPEKELLRWHYRLGHMSFKKIQFLLRTGVLTRGDSKRRLHHAACNIQTPPKCAACQYGKQHQRSTPGRVSTAVRDRDGVLKKDHLVPGQQVSIDHFNCTTKGRLLSSAGKSLRSDMFCGGCIFNDHASGFVHVEFQKHLNSHETLKAKENFELMCRDNGVIPQSYLSDNGPSFTSKSFTEKLSTFAQVIRFAGVGAHHHNGVAERSIQTIMSIARTMMLHSAIHWPEVADTTLWPMAVTHAVFLHNHMPSLETGIAPIDIFTKSRWQQHKYHDLHVWGCPVYVLEKRIADGSKLPRWKPRSTRQVNVGFSEKHASTVPLVLNLESGYITAQFHVVFDDWFSTIATSVDELPDFNSNAWAKLFGDSIYQYPFDDELDENTDETALTNVNDAPPDEHVDRIAAAMDHGLPVEPFLSPPPPVTRFPTTPLPVSTPLRTSLPSNPMSSTRERTPEVDSIVDTNSPEPQTLFHSPQLETPRPPTPSPIQSMSPMREPPMSETREPSPKPAPPPSPKQASPAPKSHSPRRSGRNRSAPNRLGYDGKQGAGYFVEPSAWLFPECGLLPPPLALKVTPSDPDTLSYEAAMSDNPQNISRWMEAAAKEIASLEKNGTWFEVDMSVAKTRILPGTWVFRRKRTPDGEISKFKARYCVRGDLEEGEPETFAPVVAWSSVRLFLVLSLTLNWDTCSIDFSSAFVQAHLEEPVWIHLPRGFRSEEGSNKCLQLVKSLYGLSVAPRLWFEHVLEAFTDQGFKQSQMDPCLLYKETILIVIYVDDVGIAYANESDLEKLLQNLTKRGLEFTKEGTFTDFLGIKFIKDPKNNTVTLTQRGLIQKIIATTGMSDCNPNWTPATQTALGIDPDGEPMQETWSYPSVVGMMLYLSTNTRPDISFAVSQVARFNHSPKKSHATAIKTIVRYLHRTSDKGTIVRPTGDLSVDCYVDADFAGLHGCDPDYAPSSAKSRTGYIISLGGCPILWKSQLQTEISLSTLEAEYSALSASMRTLLPLRSLLSEIVAGLKLPPEFKSTIRCRVFEDNNGALLLATKQRITNRTKYFLVKWHFFWSHVQNGDVDVLKIDTTEQWADYFTKGLSREAFERIRKLVQGW